MSPRSRQRQHVAHVVHQKKEPTSIPMMSQVRKRVALRTSFEHMNWFTEVKTPMVMDFPCDAVQERQRYVFKAAIFLDDG